MKFFILVKINLVLKSNIQVSTDICIFASKTLTHCIIIIPVQSSILMFFYASKAFDKINHWTLYRKLIKRSVPSVIICILLFLSKIQSVCVKWSQCSSLYFNVSKSLRQSSILSPQLFFYTLMIYLKCCFSLMLVVLLKKFVENILYMLMMFNFL